MSTPGEATRQNRTSLRVVEAMKTYADNGTISDDEMNALTADAPGVILHLLGLIESREKSIEHWRGTSESHKRHRALMEQECDRMATERDTLLEMQVTTLKLRDLIDAVTVPLERLAYHSEHCTAKGFCPDHERMNELAKGLQDYVEQITDPLYAARHAFD